VTSCGRPARSVLSIPHMNANYHTQCKVLYSRAGVYWFMIAGSRHHQDSGRRRTSTPAKLRTSRHADLLLSLISAFSSVGISTIFELDFRWTLTFKLQTQRTCRQGYVSTPLYWTFGVPVNSSQSQLELRELISSHLQWFAFEQSS